MGLSRSLPARSPNRARQAGVYRLWTSILLNPRRESRSEEREFSRVNSAVEDLLTMEQIEDNQF